MGDISGLCLFCGSYTTSKAADGGADCDRLVCILKRNYAEELERAALPKDVGTWRLV